MYSYYGDIIMLRINQTTNVDMSASIAASSSTEASKPDISFPDSGLDDYLTGKNTKETVKNTLRAHKQNIELHVPWIGSDYIIYKGDGKTTYGTLRQNLGIPPRVLSETNGKNLSDDQIVKDTKIYLEDIGWYETTPQFEGEAADIRAQRSYGNHFAGYNRSVTNDEVKAYLK